MVFGFCFLFFCCCDFWSPSSELKRAGGRAASPLARAPLRSKVRWTPFTGRPDRDCAVRVPQRLERTVGVVAAEAAAPARHLGLSKGDRTIGTGIEPRKPMHALQTPNVFSRPLIETTFRMLEKC